MSNITNLVEWATEQATALLPPLGDRWLHVQGVVEKARWVGQILHVGEREYLIAAAYLHDIAYAPSLQRTKFHPLDGAYYLQSCNQNRLASLVAYHSGAQFEAQMRGLAPELETFSRESSEVADALIYCDMTTNSTGMKVTFQERLDDIFRRYDETHIVNQAMHQATPFLSQSVERTQQALYEHGILKEI